MNSEDLFTPYEGEDKYIFISYSHDNSKKVYDIISAFHNRGYSVGPCAWFILAVNGTNPLQGK